MLIFGVFAKCHVIDPKQPIATFEDIVDNSTATIAGVRAKICEMNATISANLTHFIHQVQDISLLLRADYQILATIGAIPKTMVPYVIEREVNAPSIVVARTRDALHFKERRRAYDRKVYLPTFFQMMKLVLRHFMITQLRTILREFYFRFTETPPSTAHKIHLELDRERGLRMSPTLQEFLAWFAQVEKSLRQIFMGESIALEQEVLDEIFPEGDNSEVLFTEAVCEDAELEKMRASAIEIIGKAYEHFAVKAEPGAEFLKNAQERLVELNTIEGFEDAYQFVSVADEISDLLSEIESIQRIVNYAALHTDVKPGKTSALFHIKTTIEKVKGIGIAMSKHLYEEITQAKNVYIKFKSVSSMAAVPGTDDSGDDAAFELKQKIRELCSQYMPVTESILLHWSESAIEIEEEYGNVQDVLALVTSTPRPPKRGRGGRGRRVVRRRVTSAAK
jgi:hypothetical protein